MNTNIDAKNLYTLLKDSIKKNYSDVEITFNTGCKVILSVESQEESSIIVELFNKSNKINSIIYLKN